MDVKELVKTHGIKNLIPIPAEKEKKSFLLKRLEDTKRDLALLKSGVNYTALMPQQVSFIRFKGGQEKVIEAMEKSVEQMQHLLDIGHYIDD